MEKLVIDRSRWLRGEGGDYSKLLRSGDNKMCCLGFYLRNLGYSDENIEDLCTPNSVLTATTVSWLLKDGGVYNSDDSCELMKVNDTKAVTPQEREDRVKELFLKNGVEVTFVDGVDTVV